MVGSGTSTSQKVSNLRCSVRVEQLMLPAIAARLVPVVRCWMNARNRAALVISLRCLVSEAPQVLHRHRVVPLLVVPFRFISPPQWQRGRFFGMGQPNHRRVAHHGSHTGDFRKGGPIYAFGAYIFRKRGVQSMKINDSGHTFCRLTRYRRDILINALPFIGRKNMLPSSHKAS